MYYLPKRSEFKTYIYSRSQNGGTHEDIRKFVKSVVTRSHVAGVTSRGTGNIGKLVTAKTFLLFLQTSTF